MLSAGSQDTAPALGLYDSFFHLAYPNNYVYLLIPRRYNPKVYLAEITEKTKSFNEASFELFKYCKNLLSGHAPQELIEWNDAIAANKNLLTIYPAEKLIKFIETNILQESIKSNLEKHNPALLRQFSDIPKELLEIMRINFYLAPELLETALEELLRILQANSFLADKIERVEIAQPGIKNRESANYPTLIIYFNLEVFNNSELKFFLKTVASFAKKNQGLSANPDLAYVWFPHVTVTQGYRLYKRYLRCLGLLTEIYDNAFVKAQTSCWEKELSLAIRDPN